MKNYPGCFFILFIYATGGFSQSVMFSQNFGNGLNGWKTISNGDSIGKWKYTHNPVILPDSTALTLNSSSAANGFVVAVSDSITDTVSADLISPAYSCAGHNYVWLQFAQWFNKRSAAIAIVYVSANDTLWTPVYAADSSTGANNERLILNISALAANQQSVYFKFHYQASNDLFWAVDDIVMFDAAPIDVSVTGVGLQQFIPLGYDTVSFTIKNVGGEILKNVTVSYVVNGQGPVAENFSGLNLAPFQSQTMQFSSLVNISAVGDYSFSVFSSMPNGGIDARPGNDTAKTQCISLSHVADKNVLLEEYTTVPCGWCPGADTKRDQLLQIAGAYTIPVAIHAGFGTDAMTVRPEDSILAEIYSPGSSPAGTIDRAGFPGTGYSAVDPPTLSSTANPWLDDVEARHKILPPLSIASSNTFDSALRVLNVSVSATFYGKLTGAFSLNCYIIEDSVTGTGSGYDQHNFNHDSPGDSTTNPWLGVGTTNLGSGDWLIAGFVHRYVVRKILGGAWGSSGVIPPSTTDNGVYTKTYTDTIPDGWNAEHIKLVATAGKYGPNMQGSNEIYNAIETSLNWVDSTPVTGLFDANLQLRPGDRTMLFTLYPNPAKDELRVSFSFSEKAFLNFEILSIAGQRLVASDQRDYSPGENAIAINTSQLPTGLYILAIRNNNRLMQTSRFVVMK